MHQDEVQSLTDKLSRTSSDIRPDARCLAYRALTALVTEGAAHIHTSIGDCYYTIAVTERTRGDDPFVRETLGLLIVRAEEDESQAGRCSTWVKIEWDRPVTEGTAREALDYRLTQLEEGDEMIESWEALQWLQLCTHNACDNNPQVATNLYHRLSVRSNGAV